ncbi:hypothetical protein [Hyalangium rubrum]|uniref:Uncharacterized protein n=1 Tax=Hyalangium rubrum TaxID=3103134 RepID=A0ABU5HF50_9BACT|nr:hypothetical protein [Hyalangium sp. s54d21]MDY7231885.1 hypothetical protein [Hyalangium sp. s54d21]
MRPPALPFLALLASLLVGGPRCTPPRLPYNPDLPALQLSVVGQPPVRDGRARFRELFCALLERESTAGLDCESLLVRFTDEPVVPAETRALPAHDPRLHLLLVAGSFAECFDAARMYPGAVRKLSSLGYAIREVRVSGRSSSAYNTPRIARAVARELRVAEGPLVLVGYSKGVTDILEFLIQYPSLAAKVQAVVSIAGSVNGSPMAERFAGPYRPFASWPVDACPPGDSHVIEDLRRETRMNWLARHRLPGHIRYFSVGASAPAPEVGRAMFPIEGPMRRLEPYIDGQLPFYDQLVPGSELLGYARADHWAVALPLQEHWPVIAGNPRGAIYPRDLLFEAIVLRTAEALRETLSPERPTPLH